MTPERLKKIEDFKYTPSGEAAQCFIDELTAEIRSCWKYIRLLEEMNGQPIRNHPDNRQANPAEDAGEHPPAIG